MVTPNLAAQPGKNGPTCMVKLFSQAGRTVKPAGQMVQPSHTVKPVQAVRKAGQKLMVRSGQTARRAGQMAQPCSSCP